MSCFGKYRVGLPGVAWGQAEKEVWLSMQSVKRSYEDEVLAKLRALETSFDIEQYGALSVDADRYPLWLLKSRAWDKNKKTILITGGVHGYETSGVQGAIRFLETQAQAVQEQINLLVFPCVSPWGYETVNRWNPVAVDPNRSFSQGSLAEESRALMLNIASIKNKITVHIDLHETTDTDNSEFRPALASRDGIELVDCSIPDGFYLVGDVDRPVAAFQKAIIEAVKKVTHIAAPDENGEIIGVTLAQCGVINYATKTSGLCTGFSDAEFSTTTEVYPDSPEVDGENCIRAQVTAITAAINYALNTQGN
jgi:hypothetical protein